MHRYVQRRDTVDKQETRRRYRRIVCLSETSSTLHVCNRHGHSRLVMPRVLHTRSMDMTNCLVYPQINATSMTGKPLFVSKRKVSYVNCQSAGQCIYYYRTTLLPVWIVSSLLKKNMATNTQVRNRIERCLVALESEHASHCCIVDEHSRWTW
jgi:hypothetical protein